ncbi:MAG: hypothetical protein SFY80_16710 [Verrucomicrobiota bacterium]|nr:hypothetical protein [Verrucomicrobiota bacterium]
MCGGHPGMVSQHVFADEGEELPLLTGRAARGQRGRAVGRRRNGLQRTKRSADADRHAAQGRPGFTGCFGQEGLILEDDVQSPGRIVEQRAGFACGLTKDEVFRLEVRHGGMVSVHVSG